MSLCVLHTITQHSRAYSQARVIQRYVYSNDITIHAQNHTHFEKEDHKHETKRQRGTMQRRFTVWQHRVYRYRTKYRRTIGPFTTARVLLIHLKSVHDNTFHTGTMHVSCKHYIP